VNRLLNLRLILSIQLTGGLLVTRRTFSH